VGALRKVVVFRTLAQEQLENLADALEAAMKSVGPGWATGIQGGFGILTASQGRRNGVKSGALARWRAGSPGRSSSTKALAALVTWWFSDLLNLG